MISMGWQVTDGMFNYANWSWVYNWIEILQPHYINIQRAGQKREALDAALSVVQHSSTQVMIRNYYDGFKDEDVMKYYPASSKTGWLKAANNYYKAWLAQYVGTGLIPVTCNEISMDDYTDYSTFFGEVIRLAAADDMRVAVGRFPTHHPLEPTWASLLPLFACVERYRNAIYSPNGYWSAAEASPDGLHKQVRLLNWVEDQLDYRLECVFGEYARLRSLGDAYNGWGSITGLAEDVYAEEGVRLYKSILQPAGIEVNWFDVGNWKKSFGIGAATMKVLEAHKEELQVSTDQSPEVAVYVTPRLAEAGKFINVRAGRGTEYANLEGNMGRLYVGETALSLESQAATLSKLADLGKSEWLKVQTPLATGYVAAWVVKQAAAPAEPPTPLPTDPDLDDLTEAVRFLAEELARLQDDKVGQAEFDKILAQYAMKDDVWTLWLDRIKTLLKIGS